ncbi:MAG: hypothetical protein GYA15_11575 [Leptolinea sp.]|jgi:hypothetical protein|nr:hypothetical protein [Leptolinea sp.]
MLAVKGKITGKWNIFNNTCLLKKRKLSIFCFFTLFLTTALIFSAPEGIKTTYRPLYLRFEPVLIYFLNESIILLVTRFFLQFIDSGSSSFKEYVLFFLQTYIIPLVIFLFPFIFYFPRTIPINGTFIGIGNDFIPITYSHKVYLLDYLSKFQIPLWSPGEGAGFPFYSSPHTQTFYPLNVLLLFLYRINGGYSVLDHQRFTILGIMIFALGLYFWLSQFKFKNKTVIALSLIISCTYKLAELQRYSLATHSVAWYPWLLYALTLIFSRNRYRDLIKPSIIFFFSLVLIITAGYPYYVYYLIFLFSPIVVLLFFNHHKESIFKEQIIVKPLNLLCLTLSSVAALVITGPYLLKMYQLMNQTSGRSGNSLDYVAGHPFTFMDTLGSLIFPPTAQAEGWYYFGLLLIVILCWFLSKMLFDRKFLVETLSSVERIVVLILLISIIFICWITYGVNSELFVLLWKYFPLFSSLRTWGRLNIVTILLLTPILGFAIETFYKQLEISRRPSKESLKTLLIILAICLSITSIQIYLNVNRLYDPYWLNFFFYLSGSEWFYCIKTIAAGVFLIALLIVSKRKIRITYTPFVSSIVLFSLFDLWPASSIMWKGTEFNMAEDKRKILNISETIIPESFKYSRTDAMMAADVALTPRYFVGYADDWYFARYKEFFTHYKYETQARSELLGLMEPKKLFLSTSIDFSNISSFLQDSKAFPGQISTISYNGDSLEVNIESSKEGFFSFIDNWDPDWIAYVNKKPEKVDLLFGTFKSVRIPKGNSNVILQYSPNFSIITPTIQIAR